MDEQVIIEAVAWYYETRDERALSFKPDRDPNKNWQPLYTIEQLSKLGWRRCAVVQRTTQYCAEVESLRERIAQALDMDRLRFRIGKHGRIKVLQHRSGARRPASDEEIALWNRLAGVAQAAGVQLEE
ncbi:MAG: hypothetical protein ACK4WM_10535 [Thermoflexales bacterium]